MKEAAELSEEKGQYNRLFTWFEFVTVSTVHIEQIGPAEIKAWIICCIERSLSYFIFSPTEKFFWLKRLMRF